MSLRMVHFFLDEDDGLGWSEVWYLNSSDLTGAQQIAQTWATTRAKILSPDVTIIYARLVSNLPANTAPRPRQQRLATLQRLDVVGTANPGQQRSGDLPWTAVKCRWTSGDYTVFRTQLLRGVPDVWFDQGSDKIAQAGMGLWIPGALQVITQSGMTIRHLNPLVPPATSRVYSYTSPVFGTYEGFTRRATGRPFGLPRGRAPKRT